MYLPTFIYIIKKKTTKKKLKNSIKQHSLKILLFGNKTKMELVLSFYTKPTLHLRIKNSFYFFNPNFILFMPDSYFLKVITLKALRKEQNIFVAPKKIS